MEWMNWNIGYAVAIALLTVTVAGLAGHLASTKPWHKWVFWGAGIITVGLIYTQTRANEKSQQHLQHQLDAIQDATANKTPIFVSPTPSEKAGEGFMQLEEKVIQGRVLLEPDKSLQINYHYFNRGFQPVTDEGVVGSIMTVDAASNSDEHMVGLWQKSVREERKKLQGKGARIGINQESWSTTDSGYLFSFDEIEAIKHSVAKTYLLTASWWVDSKGKTNYAIDCTWFSGSAEIAKGPWHICQQGGN